MKIRGRFVIAFVDRPQMYGWTPTHEVFEIPKNFQDVAAEGVGAAMNEGQFFAIEDAKHNNVLLNRDLVFSVYQFECVEVSE